MERPAKIANLNVSGSSLREQEHGTDCLTHPAEEKCMEKLAAAIDRRIGVRQQDGDGMEAVERPEAILTSGAAPDCCMDMPIVVPPPGDRPSPSMVEFMDTTAMPSKEAAGNVLGADLEQDLHCSASEVSRPSSG